MGIFLPTVQTGFVPAKMYNVWCSQLTQTVLFTLLFALLEKARREQQFWCVNSTKSTYFDRENKCFVFASNRLARASRSRPKPLRLLTNNTHESALQAVGAPNLATATNGAH
jgi:hypothetical protein